MRLSPNLVKVIMGIVTLVVPFGVYPYALGNGEVEVTINSLIWVRYPDGTFYFPIHYLLELGLLYVFFNFWFGLEVILNASNRDHRIPALIIGAISLVFPFIVAASFIPWMSEANTLTYVGPIPIQLAIGLLLMRFGGERRITSALDENGTVELHS